MKSQYVKLKTIEKPKSNVLFVSNPNIGVIDTETYLCKDNIYKIYALGFKTNLEDNPKIYYIDKDNLDSNSIVLSMVNELIRPKYNKRSFYCHNLGGYDIIFLIGALFRYNKSKPDKDHYKMNYVFRDKRIIRITISKESTRKVTIRDSYTILTSSQKDLCLTFGVQSLKTDFPYKFLHQDNLLYIGNTPDISFFEDISVDSYNSIFRKD